MGQPQSEHQSPIKRTAFILAGLALSCVLLSGVALAMRPPRFSTHTEAVAYVLQQRGIPYQQVKLAPVWPDPVNYYGYGAILNSGRYFSNIIIERPEEPPVRGRLECLPDKTACRFSAPELGIRRERIPDISPDTPLPWTTTIKRWINGLGFGHF